MPNDPLHPPAIICENPDVKAALSRAIEEFERLGRKRLERALVIGQMLHDAKLACGRGYWLQWLAANFPYGRQRAADFIRVFMERDKCSRATTFEEALTILQQASHQGPTATSDSPDRSDPTPERGDAWEPAAAESHDRGEPEIDRVLTGNTTTAHPPSASEPLRGREPNAAIAGGKDSASGIRAISRVEQVIEGLASSDNRGTLIRCARRAGATIHIENVQPDPLVERYELSVVCAETKRLKDLFLALQKEVPT